MIINQNCEENDLIKLLAHFPDKSWNWYYISLNPNITWEIIRDNPEIPWNWATISYNKFKQHPI